MNRSLKNYKKQLSSLKFNKFKIFQHKIDKTELAESYKNLRNSLNSVYEEEDCLLQDLIKYENWLVGEE